MAARSPTNVRCPPTARQVPPYMLCASENVCCALAPWLCRAEQGRRYDVWYVSSAPFFCGCCSSVFSLDCLSCANDFFLVLAGKGIAVSRVSYGSVCCRAVRRGGKFDWRRRANKLADEPSSFWNSRQGSASETKTERTAGGECRNETQGSRNIAHGRKKEHDRQAGVAT